MAKAGATASKAKAMFFVTSILFVWFFWLRSVET
jgi:uncharacterized membrane protein YtjA (UPF0391 family)